MAARRRVLALFVCGACLAVPHAQAEPALNPFIMPQTDVEVMYGAPAEINGSVAAVLYRMRWSASAQKQRQDVIGAAQNYVVTDYPRQLMTQVDAEHKTRRVMRVAPALAQGVRARGVYLRVGEATIAGERCTEWQVRDSSGGLSYVCYTPDGILLRIIAQGLPRLMALHVTRAPQPESVFSVPQTYRVIPAR